MHATPVIEQLFAAGYAACFIGAMKAVAAKQGIKLPEDLSIDAEVDLGLVGQAYGVAARLTIHRPGMEREAAQKLIARAESGQDVLVFAHGYFNHMVGRALKADGWKLVQNQGFKYWSQRRYEKR